MMTNMVLCCALIKSALGRDQKIVLVRKKRPVWQAGCLNLVGGHVESGEGFIEAAIREFSEETGGFEITEEMKYVGAIGGQDWGMHNYVVSLSYQRGQELILRATELNNNDPECEEIVVMDICDALTHPDLINNLRYIIPKSLAVLDGWRDNL